MAQSKVGPFYVGHRNSRGSRSSRSSQSSLAETGEESSASELLPLPESGPPEEDPVSPVWLPHRVGSKLSSASHTASEKVHMRVFWSSLNGNEFDAAASDEDRPLCPRPTLTEEDLAGPMRIIGPFDFVERASFKVIVGLVLTVNFIVITYKSTSEELAPCSQMDLFFTAFYALELLCRIGRQGFQGHFVESNDRLWNLGDVAVAAIAAGRRVVVPIWAPGHANDLVWIVLTSCSRILRMLRMVRLMLRAKLVWTQTAWFQWTVAAVIGANAIIMGVEADHPSPWWWWVDQATLAFFLFEVSARIRIDGLVLFFTDPEERAWNIIDFLIVVFGALDLWAARLSELVSGHKHVGGFGKMIMLVRMLRLLRILRLLKLVKAVGPLYSLALGVTQAMQSIFWVLVLTVVTLYAFAILTTRMVGHGLIVDDDSDLPADVKAMFATIWDSMFTLFGIMNNQYYTEIQPLLELVPATKPVFVIFTICSSWALLSVMTGVVSDHMMSVREMQAQKDEVAIEERRWVLQKSLRGIFAAADKDGSGTLGNDEYMELLKSPFHKEKIQELTRMPVQDLAMMFEWLDVDRSGEIDFQELLHGCDWLNEPINGKSVLKIGHAARSHCVSIRDTVRKLRAEVDELTQKRAGQREELRGLVQEMVDLKQLLHEADTRISEAKSSNSAADQELQAAKEALAYTSVADAADGGDPTAVAAAAAAGAPMEPLRSSPSWARLSA